MEENNQESISVKFSVSVVTINDLPFELMLNLALVDDPSKSEYGMIWTITLQSFHNDENGLPLEDERAKLMGFFQESIQRILKHSEIKIVGTTLHQGAYDIMFYAKEEEMTKVGGNVAELPEYIEDQKGRFVNFSGKPDPNWEKFHTYLQAFN